MGLRIRKTDGFDWQDAGRVHYKYNAYSASFDQVGLAAGRDGSGQAFLMLNNAFGQANYLDLFPAAQNVWGFHADFQVSRVGTTNGFQPVVFYVWQNSASGDYQLLLKVRADGRLAVLDGISGSELDATISPLTMDTWYTLEAWVNCGGGGAAAEIRLNGVTVLSVGGFGNGQPVDVMGFRWQVFGPPSLVWDNYVVYDYVGSGVHFNGRVRINPLFPVNDAVARWSASPGPSLWAMVNDHLPRFGGSPDDDLTTISPVGATVQLFDIEVSPCFGLVLGVAIDVVLRPNGSLFPFHLVTQPEGSVLTLGTLTPYTAGYATMQAIGETNPASGEVWTDAAISSSWWGISAGGTPLVSAFHLEKITSLEPLPYDCGVGNYAF